MNTDCKRINQIFSYHLFELRLLETLLNWPDFEINQVKIGNETPLIYAIQTADS